MKMLPKIVKNIHYSRDRIPKSAIGFKQSQNEEEEETEAHSIFSLSSN